MFGQEQPAIVTEEDVGDYVDQLQKEGQQEINNHIVGEQNELARPSERPTCGSKNKN